MVKQRLVSEEFDWTEGPRRTTLVTSVADLAGLLQFRSNDWQPLNDLPGEPADEARAPTTASTFVWRGVGNRYWALHPSLYRRALRSHRVPDEVQVRSIEREILTAARKARYGERDGRLLTDLELLAVLQHHGAATRLLDVTRNVLVALWFATQPAQTDSGSDADGVLFGIDVTGRTLAPRQESWTIDGLTRQTGLWHWEPPPLEQRIRAQQGSFVFSRVTPVASSRGALLTSLDLRFMELEALKVALNSRMRSPHMHVVSQALVVFTVPSWAKASIRDELGTFFGQDERTIFPDLSGFARSWGANV